MAASIALPALVEVPLGSLGTGGPEMQRAAVAIAGTGQLAFSTAFDDSSRVFTLVDSMGRLIRRFGRHGPGPTELGIYNVLAFDGNKLVAGALDRGTVVVFDSLGHAIAESPNLDVRQFVRLTADSVDYVRLQASREQTARLAIWRVSVHSGQGRVLLRPSPDSLFSGIRVPSLVSDGRRIILADRASYSFVAYDTGGSVLSRWRRDLPPALLDTATVDRVIAGQKRLGGTLPGARERLLDEPQPQFLGMAIDGRGRLWVNVDDERTASSYADVFADTLFLGRMPLPCRVVGAALWITGDRLAVLCVNNNRDSGIELRVFRIG